MGDGKSYLCLDPLLLSSPSFLILLSSSNPVPPPPLYLLSLSTLLSSHLSSQIKEGQACDRIYILKSGTLNRAKRLKTSNQTLPLRTNSSHHLQDGARQALMDLGDLQSGAVVGLVSTLLSSEERFSVVRR